MVYRSSKYKTILFLLVSIGFVVAGWYGRYEMPFYVGYLSMAFFGLGVIVFLVQLHPNASMLVLDKDSFKYRLLFKDASVAWADISHFFEITMQDGKATRVAWQYRTGSDDPSIPHGWLPDNFGKKSNELVEILNSYKEKNT